MGMFSRITIIITLVSMLFVLGGCSSEKDSTMVLSGKWQTQTSGHTIEFIGPQKIDWSGVKYGYDIEADIEGNILVVHDGTGESRFYFKNENDLLYLSDSSDFKDTVVYNTFENSGDSTNVERTPAIELVAEEIIIEEVEEVEEVNEPENTVMIMDKFDPGIRGEYELTCGLEKLNFIDEEKVIVQRGDNVFDSFYEFKENVDGMDVFLLHMNDNIFEYTYKIEEANIVLRNEFGQYLEYIRPDAFLDFGTPDLHFDWVNNDGSGEAIELHDDEGIYRENDYGYLLCDYGVFDGFIRLVVKEAWNLEGYFYGDVIYLAYKLEGETLEISSPTPNLGDMVWDTYEIELTWSQKQALESDDTSKPQADSVVQNPLVHVGDLYKVDDTVLTDAIAVNVTNISDKFIGEVQVYFDCFDEYGNKLSSMYTAIGQNYTSFGYVQNLAAGKTKILIADLVPQNTAYAEVVDIKTVFVMDQ